MTHRVLVIPGDGIGAEVMPHVLRVLGAIDVGLWFEYGDLGGQAIDKYGTPLPQPTLDAARAMDAVLLGAVGGPRWDDLPMDQRPEKGLLGPPRRARRLRQPASGNAVRLPGRRVVPAPGARGGAGHPHRARTDWRHLLRRTTGASRAATGAAAPSTPTSTPRTRSRESPAWAFNLAAKRSGKLTSVDKANVLEVTQLWRDVVTEVHGDFPDIELDHLYVDNAAMQLVRAPKQFDVIVTGNLFGDILSDAAAMLTGSLGMLPSASLNAQGQGIYEPVHGSAPDIAGRNIANPLATILSAAMMLRYSLGEAAAADRLENAVNAVLDQGARTADIMSADGAEGVRQVGTEEMADAVIAALR